MRRIKWFTLVIFSLVLLAACGKEDDHEVITEPPELEQLSVELTVTNEVEVDETVHISSLVQIGDRKIDEADEVVYEIWEEGKKSESVTIDSVNEGNGIYTAEASFDHDGLFHIQVHATAEAQHSMPIEEVTVGEGGDYEENNEPNYHTEGFDMDFMKPANVTAGDESSLLVHVKLHEEALEDLDVRYEIWHENDSDNHEWLDATEGNAGEYDASYTFEEAGKYTIVIHIEDDEELHEHNEYIIAVN